MANSHFAEEEEKNQIFSEETRISAYTNTFDCQGKSDGTKCLASHAVSHFLRLLLNHSFQATIPWPRRIVWCITNALVNPTFRPD